MDKAHGGGTATDQRTAVHESTGETDRVTIEDAGERGSESGQWLNGMLDEPFPSWASTFSELEATQCDTALFCIGAVEQHSHHLPLGTDWLLGMVISRLIGRELGKRGLPVYVLPTMPLGTSSEHLNFRGTISLSPSTVEHVLRDIAASLKHQGFKRLIVVSTHGGNWILKPVIRELNMWDPEFQVMWSRSGGSGGSGPGVDRHSGEGETSAMLSAFPELVRPGPYEDSSPDVGSEFVDMIPMEYFTPNGMWGFASKAEAARGAQAIRESAAHQADYVIETIQRLDELRQKRDGAGQRSAISGEARPPARQPLARNQPASQSG